MDIKELREKSNTELVTLLAVARHNLRALRFKVESRELKNVREIRLVREQIARLQTLLRERVGVSHKN